MTTPLRSPSPSRKVLKLSLFAGLIVTALGAAGPASTQGSEAGAAPESEIQRFCSNIAEPARDRRYALQAAELAKLQADIDDRIVKLEEKRAEYEAWLKKRDDFMSMAQKELVDIYSKMRPDAAAERMAQLDVMLAAALLMKLEARFAGIVLNEMDAKTAAALTGVIASSAQEVDPS